jgi:hypothetical protein
MNRIPGTRRGFASLINVHFRPLWYSAYLLRLALTLGTPASRLRLDVVHKDVDHRATWCPHRRSRYAAPGPVSVWYEYLLGQRHVLIRYLT